MNSFPPKNYNKINKEGINNLNNRLLLISFLMVVSGLVITMRLVEISLPNKKNKDNILTYEKANLKNSRGLLLDRNNRILASNIYIYNLKAYPKKISNPKQTLNLLKKEIDIFNYERLLKKIKDKTKYEVLVKKNITAPEAKKINNLGIPGLEFIPTIKRFYPHKALVSHYVGHVNDDMKGQLGAERTFDDLLSVGNDVRLGVDIRIQYIVRDELKKAMKKYKAKGATAIIANIENGEILSMVSLPDFNPNKSIDPKNISYTNSATLNLYEMGSTFKIFSIAAALEKLNISLDSKFNASKPIKISNYIIKDYHPENRFLSIREIFLKSSNIGASLVALQLGENKLKSFYNDLGLLTISKVNLVEKTSPIAPKKWGQIETATLSFGHGLSISPMQMIEAASKLFNNNKNFIANIKKTNSSVSFGKTKIISSNTLNALKFLMYENTVFGTAKKAEIPGYYIGGKTATGEKVVDGKYDKNKLVSSFLSIFPADEPKYLSLVLFDEPGFDYKKQKSQGATGGLTAAPVTSKILKRIFPILGVNKNLEWKPNILLNEKDKINFVSY